MWMPASDEQSTYIGILDEAHPGPYSRLDTQIKSVEDADGSASLRSKCCTNQASISRTERRYILMPRILPALMHLGVPWGSC